MFTLKVAFQGELGAYSEMAVYSFFGKNVEVYPCKSFDEVFENVKSKNVDYGVVPIENSIEGSVNRPYDLFLDYDLRKEKDSASSGQDSIHLPHAKQSGIIV